MPASEPSRAVIEALRAEVEDIVQNDYGQTLDDSWRSRDWQGKASTNPVRNQLTAGDVMGHCGYACGVLKFELARRDVMVERYHADVRRPEHVYLSLPWDRRIIIDPTIGQYLTDHPHIFVGTRDELREAIARSFERDAIDADFETPEECFNQLWGATGVQRIGGLADYDLTIYYVKFQRRLPGQRVTTLELPTPEWDPLYVRLYSEAQ